MQRVFNWIVDRPRLCAVLALALPLVFAAGLPRLEIDGSTRSLFPTNEPDVEYYQNVRANFGSDSLITVVVHTDDIFRSEALHAMRDLASEFEAIDGVRSTLSLFSLKTPRKTGTTLRIEPLVREIPENAEGLEKLRREALANPIASGSILNEDGTAAAIHVLLRAETGQPGFEEGLVSAIRDRVDSATAKQGTGQGIEFYAVGAPIIKSLASRYIWQDLVVLGPIALLVIGAVIFLFYRSALATFLPLITGALSVVATLGFMGLAGFAINPFASVIVILILVMGCTEDLHIMAEYMLGLRNGLPRQEALRILGRVVGSALLLTSATTFLGFLSIAPNPISGLREFAIACAVGIFLNFLITLLLVPSLIQFFRPLAAPRRAEAPHLAKLQEWLEATLKNRPRAIAAFFLIMILAAGAGTARLEVDTSYIRFFPANSEIGRSYAKFSRDFGGASFFMVTVETGRSGGIYELETFREVAKLHDHLSEQFEHTIGYVDFIRQTRQQFSERREELPSSLRSGAEEIENYNYLLGRRLLSSFVDHDGSRTAIRVRSFIPGSKGMRQAEEEILRYARENLPPDLEVRVTGERVLTARFSDKVTRQLVQNLLILSGVVTVLLILFFRSVKLGLLAIVPNSLPVVATFGYMGWAGIPLSTGTFAVAIVALGIAVDDTIHFITRYFHESKAGVPVDKALSRTLSKELQPILTTSIALALGYLVMVFSPFLIHQETGILFAIAISTACVADLFMTPLLLRFFAKSDQPAETS